MFDVLTPLGFTVRTSEAYWHKIVIKHPDIHKGQDQVKLALSEPDQIRRSSRDPEVLLFYRVLGQGRRWLVAVVRRLSGEGFLITAYQTDAVKEGEQLWPR